MSESAEQRLLHLVQQCSQLTSCAPGCPCRKLSSAVGCIDDWDAVRATTNIQQMMVTLPAMVQKLLPLHSLNGVRAGAHLYSHLVVAPVHLLLTSVSDPDEEAAGRTLALQAALWVRQSGLLTALEAKADSASSGLSSVWAAFKAFLTDTRGLKKHYTPLRHLGSSMQPLDCDLQALFGWVRRLALFWPGSILAAAGVGPLARRALLLVPRALDHVVGCDLVNEKLQAQPLKAKHLQKFQLDAPCLHTSAEAVYMAALLLQDLAQHVHNMQSPQSGQPVVLPPAVVELLRHEGALAEACVQVVTVYGSHLQQHLSMTLLLEEAARDAVAEATADLAPQLASLPGAAAGRLKEILDRANQQAAAGSSGSSTRDQDTLSGSSSVRDQAAGVLLCRADRLARQSSRDVLRDRCIPDTWHGLFDEAWVNGGWSRPEVTHIVGHAIAEDLWVPSAAERAEGNPYWPSSSSDGGSSDAGSSDIDGSDGSDGSSCEDGSDVVSSDGSSDAKDSDSSDSSDSSSSEEGDMARIPRRACLAALTAAAEVLDRVLGFHPCQQQPLAKLPVLLLCSAVAGLRVLPCDQGALRLIRSAAAATCHLYGLKVLLPLQELSQPLCPDAAASSSTPGGEHDLMDELGDACPAPWQCCEACQRLRQRHVWPCIGLVALLLQQLLVAARENAAEAAAGGRAAGLVALLGGVVQSPEAARQAAAAGAKTDGELCSSMLACLLLLPKLLLAAGLQPSSVGPQQLEQAAFAVQVAEAAARYLGQRAGAAAVAAEAAAATRAPAATDGTQEPAAGAAQPSSAERGSQQTVAVARLLPPAEAAPTQQPATGAPACAWQRMALHATSPCLATGSAALQLQEVWRKSSISTSSGASSGANSSSTAAEASGPKQQEQQVLAAVTSLLGTVSKLQAAMQQPASVEGLRLATQLLRAWSRVEPQGAFGGAFLQQPQQQQQQQQQQGQAAGGSSRSQGAAAALHVAGCYLLQMAGQVRATVAETMAAASNGRPIPLPPWLSREFLPQSSSPAGDAAQQQHQNGIVAHQCMQNATAFLDAMRQLAALVEASSSGSSSSSSPAARQQQQLLFDLKQASEAALWLGAARKRQHQLELQNLEQQQQLYAWNTLSAEALTTPQIKQPLQRAGQALCAAAGCSSCCRNAGCANLATVSECFALVRGKQCVCGGCLGTGQSEAAAGAAGEAMAARYCSRACLAADWPIHCQVCGWTKHKQGAGQAAAPKHAAGGSSAAAGSAAAQPNCKIM